MNSRSFCSGCATRTSQLARCSSSRHAGSTTLNVVPCRDAALHRDLSAVIADDAVADAQAEAGALADVARREERIEDAREIRRVDAVARVGHRQLDQVRRRVVADRDREPAIVRRRIACSALSIRLSSTCCSWPKSASTFGTTGGKSVVSWTPDMRNAYSRSASTRWQTSTMSCGARAAPWRRANASRLRTMRAARSDSSAMRRRSLATSSGGTRVDAVAQLLLDQLRVADDAGERVVQLVRDAGNELADGRQLLRLDQLRLRRLQLLERGDEPAVGRSRARCSSPAAAARWRSPR